MTVVGICRFSLVGRGDWKSFRGKTDAQVEQIVQQRAAVLFTPERMEARLKTFEALTLASLRAQTDQDFHFLVLASELMPPRYKRRLKAMCDKVPQVSLHYFPIIAAHVAQRDVLRDWQLDYANVLQFRLDDDDCVASDFISLLKDNTEPFMKTDKVFATSFRGVVFSSVGGDCAGVYNWGVDFLGAGLALRHPGKSIYQFGHFGMSRRFPSLLLPGRKALVTHNGLNDTRLTPSRVAMREMTLMSAEEIEAEITENYNFLTAKAKEIAGLKAPAEEPAEKPAEPLAKAPAKARAKAPAKTSAKPETKASAKTTAKTTPKTPARTRSKTTAKSTSKAPAKTRARKSDTSMEPAE